LIQAIFRIIEPSPEKSIKIDGIAASDVSLFDLRSRLSIIPQEPFCFKGTLRFNLDPFERYTDDELWTALEKVELKKIVSSSVLKLQEQVSENGSNWSVGERQLICLARAILKNTKLIIMDEATSSVDVNTDNLIQQAIRKEFRDSTVLTIAHRLDTIIDFDRVLVLDSGRIVEFGSPKELLLKPTNTADAWFSRMVDDMGNDSKDRLKALLNI
jgi:ATP-binding cassette subfamily C (CFTR/MRP) protein 4